MASNTRGQGGLHTTLGCRVGLQVKASKLSTTQPTCAMVQNPNGSHTTGPLAGGLCKLRLLLLLHPALPLQSHTRPWAVCTPKNVLYHNPDPTSLPPSCPPSLPFSSPAPPLCTADCCLSERYESMVRALRETNAAQQQKIVALSGELEKKKHELAQTTAQQQQVLCGRLAAFIHRLNSLRFCQNR